MSDRKQPTPIAYDPSKHIHPVLQAGTVDSVIDQREITVQSYQTATPFDFAALNAGFEGAWMTPHVRFGVIQRRELAREDEIHVVLGLQGELPVRAFDFHDRRPLYFAWHDVIVDTVAVRYSRDEDGLVRFTTFGGGARINDDKLHFFNEHHLKIPRDTAIRRQFDLGKLRQLCFDRFASKLYMLRFSTPTTKEYRSIDRARFSSRGYIDPETDRLKEIREDPTAQIESFDSDVKVKTAEMVGSVAVRFKIRGSSGALRLGFPSIVFTRQIETIEDEVRVFYDVVDTTVKVILDGDYYAHQQVTLDKQDKEPEFPQFADIQPYKMVLSRLSELKRFFEQLDLGAQPSQWLPHLRAVSSLATGPGLAAEITTCLGVLASRSPSAAIRLLNVSVRDLQMGPLARLMAKQLSAARPRLAEELRMQVEAALLAWALVDVQVEWDVEPEADRIRASGLQWTTDELSLEALIDALGKLVPQLHQRLLTAAGDISEGLAKYQWCISTCQSITKSASNLPASLRLVVINRVPRSLLEADKVLAAPVSDWATLDAQLLQQLGLPVWPRLRAERQDASLLVTNDGVGVALRLRVGAPGKSQLSTGVDLPPGSDTLLPGLGQHPKVEFRFEKYGAERMATAEVLQGGAKVISLNSRRAQSVVSRKSLEFLRGLRKRIDKAGTVIGSSQALLGVFEEISVANENGSKASVLLLGEAGTGKTHLAQLIHSSSNRSGKKFLPVNAGAGGGDLNIQRGEWIGFGKGHGVAGVDRAGKAGHLINANGGTLFVDEFASFSPDLQVIFLSVLEGRSVEKVGGESFTPDVRCIFATNAIVEELVRTGRLRADLNDRLDHRITLPALRDRREDVIPLAMHFVGEGANLVSVQGI
jgi:hypothetical protein